MLWKLFKCGLDANHQYIKGCTTCGNLFVAHNAGMNEHTLCYVLEHIFDLGIRAYNSATSLNYLRDGQSAVVYNTEHAGVLCRLRPS